jgi:3-(3-hydroxy-phenyl)propionate hydroxylase
LLSKAASSGRGSLFPQPRLRDGALMDERCGRGWRLVHDAALAPAEMDADVTAIAVERGPTAEAEGVVAAWLRRHACHAALLRPDHYVYGTAAGAAELAALLAERRAALDR